MNCISKTSRKSFKGLLNSIILILLFSFSNLMAIELNQKVQNVNIFESDKEELSKFGVKISKNSLEIADINAAKPSNLQKIVIGSKKISVKNLKKNETFENTVVPQLVVYKFKKGSTTYFKIPKEKAENISVAHSQDSMVSALIAKNQWFSIHTQIKEKSGELSDVWIWYDPADAALQKLTARNKDIIVENKIFKESISHVGNISIKNVYPNPANYETTLQLELKKADKLKIQVIDITGNVVIEALPDFTKFDAGFHDFKLDLNKIQSGMYFINVQGDYNTLETARLIIIR
jgi:hypothetical protein